MGWWPLNETSTIGLISVAFGGGVAALINAAVQKALKRSDIAAIGLTAVMTGYKTLIDQQQVVIDGLRAELRELDLECERRVKAIEERLNAAELLLRGGRP